MNINTMKMDDIADYINKELNSGRSMKDIEINDFNVNPRVIHKRLDRRGYKKINNNYIKVKCGDRDGDTSIKLENEIIKNNSIKSNKIKDIQKYNNDININELKELIQLIEPIKEVIKEYNRNKSIVEVEAVELRPKAVTEVRQKLFKIDVNVLNKWEQFVLDHKEYKVQQLISLALEEFVDRYK